MTFIWVIKRSLGRSVEFYYPPVRTIGKIWARNDSKKVKCDEHRAFFQMVFFKPPPEEKGCWLFRIYIGIYTAQL